MSSEKSHLSFKHHIFWREKFGSENFLEKGEFLVLRVLIISSKAILCIDILDFDLKFSKLSVFWRYHNFLSSLISQIKGNWIVVTGKWEICKNKIFPYGLKFWNLTQRAEIFTVRPCHDTEQKTSLELPPKMYLKFQLNFHAILQSTFCTSTKNDKNSLFFIGSDFILIW